MTTTSKILRDTMFVSPATGRTYWIDDKGKAREMRDEDEEQELGCECEIDWRCPHHAGQPTFLETRYDR